MNHQKKTGYTRHHWPHSSNRTRFRLMFFRKRIVYLTENGVLDKIPSHGKDSFYGKEGLQKTLFSHLASHLRNCHTNETNPLNIMMINEYTSHISAIPYCSSIVLRNFNYPTDLNVGPLTGFPWYDWSIFSRDLTI